MTVRPLADVVARVARAIEATRGSPVARHARERRGALAAAALAVVLGTCGDRVPEGTESGIAAALADAAGGEVAAGDVVWEPSRGAVVDFAWGRGVTFLARTPGPDGVGRRDVHRARVAVAPGGRPLRVNEVTRWTDTPLADEHDLVARGERVAWIARGVGGEHGATVQLPAAATGLDRLVDATIGAGLPARAPVHVVLHHPAASLRAELRDEGLVLAVGEGSDRAAVLVDPVARLAQREPTAPRLAVVAGAGTGSLLPASWWDASVPPRGESAPPEGVSLHGDDAFPPRGAEWTALTAPAEPVAGDTPAPAPVVRAIDLEGGGRVVLHAFDLRQLDLRVVPGPAAPAARSGLPGSGVMAPADVPRTVATALITPSRDAGAREDGREIAPARGGRWIAVTATGAAAMGTTEAATVASGVELLEPRPGDPVAAWCALGPGVVVSATARGGERAAVARSLAALGCEAPLWVRDRLGEATPRAGSFDGAPQAAPFLAFVRRRAFPEGRGERWTASPGRQPPPSFRPAVLETSLDVLGTPVRVVAFVGGRLGWAIRAGTDERSHRMGGSFAEVIEEPLRPRIVAVVGLGIGERRRPNGLTIGGSTGHRYASRGAVLFAEAGGLRLVRSSDVRGDPAEDATELPLSAEDGAITSAGRERGLLHERADLCVLADGTALVATARFDSHEASAQALVRLGCSDVAALDRGLDLPAVLLRTGDQPAPASLTGTALLALEPGQ